jgi:hypothetical protein
MAVGRCHSVASVPSCATWMLSNAVAQHEDEDHPADDDDPDFHKSSAPRIVPSNGSSSMATTKVRKACRAGRRCNQGSGRGLPQHESCRH